MGAAARVVRHKEFTQQTLHKDVAIITLDQEVPEMDNVRAVCLPASGSSELCAGQKGKDSCSGDSGGPMSIGTGTSWTQIGIVSWGIGCGKSHYPGVYTRVTAVKSWIDKIVSSY